MFYGIRIRRPERRREVEQNLPNSGSDLDPVLMVECAYYPRPRFYRDGEWIYPCKSCNFDEPNESCKRAHILEDTRIDELVNLKIIIRRGEKEIVKMKKRLKIK